MKKTTRVAARCLAALWLVAGLAAPVLAEDRHGERDEARQERRGDDREPDRDRDDGKPKIQVALTTPTAGTIVAAPAAVTLTASAQALQNNHRIVRVEYYQGSALIGIATSAPYRVIWVNVPAGQYRLTAKAYGRASERHDAQDKRERDHDDGYDIAVSAPVTLLVDAPPAVTLTAPPDNLRLIGPTDIALSAIATDSDGRVAKIDFYQGTTLIGTAPTAPYTATWSNAPPGSYRVTAVATDNQGITTTSAAASVTVVANVPPTVALTSPTAGQKFTAPADIALTVNAADSDGSIAGVTYFQNGTPLGTVTTAPFGYTWTSVPPGSYAITAQATDNYGAQATAASVTITVNAAPTSRMYFIHPDHLGTPRMITDTSGSPVWRWDNAEPFGNTPPDEDPQGTGTRFVFNHRYPGQYFDSETGLSYNYRRDYDPTTGRYIESDPIGLKGGINTYGYVDANPVSKIDPRGEFGVLGALVAAGLEVGKEMMLDDKSWKCVNIGRVLSAGAFGFLSPGVLNIARAAAGSAGAAAGLGMAVEDATVLQGLFSGADWLMKKGADQKPWTIGNDCECKK